MQIARACQLAWPPCRRLCGDLVFLTAPSKPATAELFLPASCQLLSGLADDSGAGASLASAAGSSASLIVTHPSGTKPCSPFAFRAMTHPSGAVTARIRSSSEASTLSSMSSSASNLLTAKASTSSTGGARANASAASSSRFFSASRMRRRSAASTLAAARASRGLAGHQCEPQSFV